MTRIAVQDELCESHKVVQSRFQKGSEATERPKPLHEPIVPHIIQCLQQDLHDIDNFYNISISQDRSLNIRECFTKTLRHLRALEFSKLDQGSRVDFLLLQSYIRRQLQEHHFDRSKMSRMQPLLDGYAFEIQDFCRKRQEVGDCDWQSTADGLTRASSSILKLKTTIVEKTLKWNETPSIADRVTRVIDELRYYLEEAFSFYKGYDPIATWWLAQPCQHLLSQLEALKDVIKEHLVGVSKNNEDAIIGDPIGRHGLLADLRAEFIPYSPEELLEIGEHEYNWCKTEMIKASTELGFGKRWRDALESVKKMFVEPGKQTLLVQKLANEAVDYVRANDMVTVPRICEKTRRTYMMTPEQQKANPFFLGGTSIIVSYPTDTMGHEAKMMSMRGNSIPFSKATVFHELIPGHHLQYHMIRRHKTYRLKMFDTPFWMEGWALYWEFLFWERGDFFTSPEDRIGTLFWRMHRCARIIFSIKFHLGQMTPQECVDYLVEKVGHERATAEGEVRRSFNGDYRPLYQAGYMLGALQFRQLRRELVDEGGMKEKDFHDRILQENEMPIDMLRALLTDKDLTEDYEPDWRFYDRDWHTLNR